MRLRPTPVQALVASFVLVIALGSWCLHQPWAARPGRQLGWIEAVFTATSATCVTGLTVRTPDDHTLAGQVVILALVQAGGLGIMTFGLFFLLLAGQRLSLFGRELILSSLAGRPWEDFWPLLRTVIGATFAIEAGGTAAMAVGWWGEKGWLAIPWGAFHAVSAFCNAGFGLHPDSLAPWRGNLLVTASCGLLIVCGGLGFYPIAELWERWRSRGRTPLSLHTRTVLLVTAWLLVAGWAGFAVLEWGTTLRGLPWHEKALGVWLQGLTPRTAGFATLDYGAMNPATLVFTMGLMFIGASPGSTGGGVKTTTVGVLVAVIIARIRSRRQVQSLRRGISAVSVGDALVVMLLASCAVLGGMLLVPLIEHGFAGGPAARSRFLAEAFEVVSAFGTVGLSTGITPALSPLSWVVLSALMFVGRVGPLTLGLALAGRRPRPEPAFAEEALMVG
ncbi:MAG TPA: potassium transporter TrkG [Thermoanaerobaculaceae bacterium]|nr:potassium transporter TrkG [Thermoanaerobaculaceae bacterium]HRS16044.1 potassium transporter TrkG [Thermoanaerobaculaceae bacterium]